MTTDHATVAAVTEGLRALTVRISSAEPTGAADLLAEALAAGGILDAVGELLDAAVAFAEDRAESAGHVPTRYRLWHTLRNVADPLHHEAEALHHLPQLLRELPASPGDPAPEPPPAHTWEKWVPPSAVVDMPAALDAITDRLDAGTITAALLLAPVLDPERGVLDRLAVLLAAASRYARRYDAAPEVWQDLGRAGQHLDQTNQTLAGTSAALAALCARTASRSPSLRQQTAPLPPAPLTRGAGDNPRRASHRRQRPAGCGRMCHHAEIPQKPPSAGETNDSAPTILAPRNARIPCGNRTHSQRFESAADVPTEPETKIHDSIPVSAKVRNSPLSRSITSINHWSPGCQRLLPQTRLSVRIRRSARTPSQFL